jgi:hypothetical protein
MDAADKVRTLSAQQDAKFEEIAAHVGGALGLDDPEACRDEAEQAIEQWEAGRQAEAEPSTPLQVLLGEHADLGRQILDIAQSRRPATEPDLSRDEA